MSDFKILQSDGWIEIDSEHMLSDALDGALCEELWAAIGQGDHGTVRDTLGEYGVYFTDPGSDGEENFSGEVSFRMVALPDDMLGKVYRIWFSADGPIEIWSES